MGLQHNVRSRRLALGWSVAKLIEEAGTTSVKPIELGRIRSPREVTINAIARALKTTVAALYTEPKAPRPKARKAGRA
jgi:transcriptional regulator with XRE-family HTH domain